MQLGHRPLLWFRQSGKGSWLQKMQQNKKVLSKMMIPEKIFRRCNETGKIATFETKREEKFLQPIVSTFNCFVEPMGGGRSWRGEKTKAEVCKDYQFKTDQFVVCSYFSTCLLLASTIWV